MIKEQFSLSCFISLNLQSIFIWLKLYIIPDPHYRNDQSKFYRQLPADHHYSIKQITALICIS
ncbi:Uncharacterised protein [Mycobacteroides abscessus subsp. abscessus]|nr:Uncharacterised protein [Mycobacteroides abscessus subsp. abscessus]